MLNHFENYIKCQNDPFWSTSELYLSSVKIMREKEELFEFEKKIFKNFIRYLIFKIPKKYFFNRT